MVQKKATRFTPDGLMELQVQIVNLSRFPQRLEHKVEWYDSQGFLIETVLSRWNEVDIRPGEPFTIEAIAPKESAANFKLYVRKDPSR